MLQLLRRVLTFGEVEVVTAQLFQGFLSSFPFRPGCTQVLILVHIYARDIRCQPAAHLIQVHLQAIEQDNHSGSRHCYCYGQHKGSFAGLIPGDDHAIKRVT